MIDIMIHACNERMWYVDGFLVPSLIAQGIPKSSIKLWIDTEHKGNLASCMESFTECGKHPGETWHLQDDVLICHDFAERAETDGSVVCGFCHTLFEPFNTPMVGHVPAIFMFNSFPCICIPNEIAEEFVEWFHTDAKFRPNYRDWVQSGKHDDSLWHDFFVEKHAHDYVWNLAPALVEHVDWLIGGSTCNSWRGYVCRASYWEDEYLVEELRRKLARH